MNIILCSIIAIWLGAEVIKADTTFMPGDADAMSDRELIEVLLKSVARQEKRVETLEETVRRQNDVITVLQKALEDKGANRDSESTPHNKSPQELRQERAAGQGIRLARKTTRQVSDSTVAFSALASHTLSHLGASQNLVFDKTNVNTNNVYNPHHGVFTAPVPGIYLITTSILTETNQEIHCDIALNGHVVAQIYARGTINKDQGSQTILLHLKQGDDVSIQNDDANDSIYGNLYTTFSGFLLFEEESTSIVG